MKLSVVIVNYNVKYYLQQCLESLQRALKGVEAEVFVVDNHSHDGSVAYLRSRFPDVHFIASAHNLGFAGGNNIAIRQSKGEYVLLLTPTRLWARRLSVLLSTSWRVILRLEDMAYRCLLTVVNEP